MFASAHGGLFWWVLILMSTVYGKPVNFYCHYLVCFDYESVLSNKDRCFSFFPLNLSIDDLVAVEGRFHKLCCFSFANPFPKYPSRGQPPSLSNLTALCTVKELHKAMEKLADDVYSLKLTKNKLKPIYF